MSPISSRNKVPPLACSNRPLRWAVAPVKAPFSWPNNSDSSSSLGMAAILIATKVLPARGLWLCRARATNSLPAPVFDGALHQAQGLVHGEGLRQVFKGTAAVGGHGAFRVGVRGDDDHGNFRRLAIDDLKQIQSADARHADVGDDDIRLLPIEYVGDVVRGFEGLYRHAGLRERLFQHPADGAVVVDNPDDVSSGHGCSPMGG